MKSILQTQKKALSYKNSSLYLLTYLCMLLLFPAYLFSQNTPPPDKETLLIRQKASLDKSGDYKLKNDKALKEIGTLAEAETFTLTPASAANNSLTQIIQSLVGQGVTISNIQTNLPQTSDIYGSYSGATDVIGMPQGLIITTGSLANAKGPNVSTSATRENGLPGNALLNQLINGTGFDASVISFNITPSANTLNFRYVLASEEYNDYVASAYNDVFGFFISGPGITGTRNIALLPGTTIPVAINNVNKGRAPNITAANPQYFINNDAVTLPLIPQAPNPLRFQNLEYDGLTVPLTATISVTPGSTYTLTFAIQDVGDSRLDSGVFIEGGSIQSKDAQSVLLTPIPDRPLGSSPFAINATATSGLPVTVSVISGPATVSGNLITLTATGTVIVQATQNGNDQYFAALPVNDTFLVTQGTVPVDTGTAKGCPVNTIITADPVTCTAKISWIEPSMKFPDSITVKNGVNLSTASLIYKGTYNGHGYYESTDQYQWTEARNAASAAGGHLVTITSAGENDFIGTQLKQQFNYTWIGLYNTGSVGNFTWVTGEPVNFTNWIPGEPNNLYSENNNATVFESYVHINGYDSLSRWNDIGNTLNTVNAKFIAEFDSALYTYRKYSGPSNGDVVTPGIYNICYERKNTITGAMDSCCFTITVTCSAVAKDCPADTTIIADPSTCKAKVSWPIPSGCFPDSISLGAANGSLRYKGTYNGHGYYQSTGVFSWPGARTAAGSAGAHLITITSPAENTFVVNNMSQTNNPAWIGLYNTGAAGSFAWVTGEPVSFTNWLPGEPNNLYNNVTNPTIFEPYVEINGWYDNTNRWNDVGDSLSVFLAEFDSAALSYRQISGPVNGDSLAPGVYTVCYEIMNSITQTADTCCFTITVVCNNNTTPTTTIVSNNARVAQESLRVFNATAFPNPTNTSFKLQITSDNSGDKVVMKVTDITGRMIEMNNSIRPGNTVSFGSSYRPGIYFTTIMQGSKVIVMKLIKQ